MLHQNDNSKNLTYQFNQTRHKTDAKLLLLMWQFYNQESSQTLGQWSQLTHLDWHHRDNHSGIVAIWWSWSCKTVPSMSIATPPNSEHDSFYWHFQWSQPTENALFNIFANLILWLNIKFESWLLKSATHFCFGQKNCDLMVDVYNKYKQ